MANDASKSKGAGITFPQKQGTARGKQGTYGCLWLRKKYLFTLVHWPAKQDTYGCLWRHKRSLLILGCWPSKQGAKNDSEGCLLWAPHLLSSDMSQVYDRCAHDQLQTLQGTTDPTTLDATEADPPDNAVRLNSAETTMSLAGLAALCRAARAKNTQTYSPTRTTLSKS